jgi:hypothetical protein
MYKNSSSNRKNRKVPAASSWGQKAEISAANAAHQALPEEIGMAAGTNGHSVVDGKITIGRFAETRWKPLKESTRRPSSKTFASHILGHIYARANVP